MVPWENHSGPFSGILGVTFFAFHTSRIPHEGLFSWNFVSIVEVEILVFCDALIGQILGRKLLKIKVYRTFVNMCIHIGNFNIFWNFILVPSTNPPWSSLKGSKLGFSTFLWIGFTGIVWFLVLRLFRIFWKHTL